MGVEENKRRLREVFDEVWNRRNLDFIDASYHRDYVFHTPAEPEPIRGSEGFKAFVRRVLGGFPDARVTIEDIVGEGDMVVGRMTMRAVHGGEYLGLPPTGTPIEITQMIWVLFEDGRLKEGWQEIDAVRLMQQLRVVPPQGVGPFGLLGWAFGTIARIAALKARSPRRREEASR
jgi:steroid delta-isomerase-like uncharacterized protein